MPYVLKDLLLDEVSLVDVGANKGAKIAVIKRASGQQLQQALHLFAKRLGVTADEIAKIGEQEATFADMLARRWLGKIMDDMQTHMGALMDTVSGIVYSADADKAAAAKQAVTDMAMSLGKCIDGYLSGTVAIEKEAITDAQRAALLKMAAATKRVYKMFGRLQRHTMHSNGGDTTKGGTDMHFKKQGLAPDVVAHIEKQEADIAKLSAEVVKLNERASKAEKEAADTKAELATLKGSGGATSDDVLKGLSPEVRAVVEKQMQENEALRKRLDESERVAKQERDARDLEKHQAVAKGLKALALTEKDGTVLKAISDKLTKDEADRIMAILKGAEAMLAASAMFREHGVGGEADENSAVAKFEAKCEELVSKGTCKTFGEAIIKAGQEFPELYNDYVAEHRERTGAARGVK